MNSNSSLGRRHFLVSLGQVALLPVILPLRPLFTSVVPRKWGLTRAVPATPGDVARAITTANLGQVTQDALGTVVVFFAKGPLIGPFRYIIHTDGRIWDYGSELTLLPGDQLIVNLNSNLSIS